jgi:hypothetical protein
MLPRPELAGAAHVIVALALPAVAATLCGALGTNEDDRAASAVSLGRSILLASVPEHAAAMPAATMKAATPVARRRVRLNCVDFPFSSCRIAATPLTKILGLAPAFW